jgi:hypothetical protein
MMIIKRKMVYLFLVRLRKLLDNVLTVIVIVIVFIILSGMLLVSLLIGEE